MAIIAKVTGPGSSPGRLLCLPQQYDSDTSTFEDASGFEPLEVLNIGPTAEVAEGDLVIVHEVARRRSKAEVEAGQFLGALLVCEV